MRDLCNRRTTVSLAFAVLTAIAVVLLGGYYESPLLFVLQIAVVAGPTFLPLALLPKCGWSALVGWAALALLMLGGWGYVVYLDTRPYAGGGASFAVLFGWFTCFIAGVIAGVISLLSALLDARRSN